MRLTTKKAVILAAGRGTRMGELTRELPKPLIPLNGRPMLLHILDRMQAAGVEEVLLVTGYLADQLEATASSHGIPVRFVRQEIANGTARATLLARDWVGGEPFLLTFGDILAESDHYRGMWQRYQGADGVLAARFVPDPYQGAAIYTDAAGRIERIVEKPPIGSSTTNWNSAGIYLFAPLIFDELARVPLSERGEYELTSAVTQMIEAGRNLGLFALEGTWMDVGRPADIAAAEQKLRG
ncbi:nucleotidyltransferase family protein [Bryobacter aggregatus]|uniref:nucleotidyltransferase family protein n=1 Tax=Bryobacter aggregatus TaxID=360054 RepID=UPI0004E0BE7D|nr:sugar phosphate nucleotidyltransferase [Bryobacter aggregatus]